MATDAYIINYGSDGTRSAGDAVFSSFSEADKALLDMLEKHPDAHTVLYERRQETHRIAEFNGNLDDGSTTYICSRYRDLGGKA